MWLFVFEFLYSPRLRSCDRVWNVSCLCHCLLCHPFAKILFLCSSFSLSWLVAPQTCQLTLRSTRSSCQKLSCRSPPTCSFWCPFHHHPLLLPSVFSLCYQKLAFMPGVTIDATLFSSVWCPMQTSPSSSLAVRHPLSRPQSSACLSSPCQSWLHLSDRPLLSQLYWRYYHHRPIPKPSLSFASQG